MRIAGIATLVLALNACERSSNDAATREPSSAAAASLDSNAADPKQGANDARSARSDDPAAASTESPPLAPVTDYVLPGALAPDIGLEQLRQLFGAANVHVEEHMAGPEGEEFRGVVLYPGDSTRRAYLYFQDPRSLRGLSQARIGDRDTRWRLDNGVAMGMSLAELTRLNGKPIRFSGLGWDYGGMIMQWNEGKLAAAEGDAVMRHARLGQIANTQADTGAYPTGDGEFSSDDKRYPKQGRLLTVVELGVSFPGEDDL